MPRSNAIVAGIRDIYTPRAIDPGVGPVNEMTVDFDGGVKGRLDMTDPRSAVWADVLRSLGEGSRPAYVEIDPASGLITEVLLPIECGIVGLEPTPDGLDVELVISHGRHLLSRSDPHFEELSSILRDALNHRTKVLVTELLDTPEIIDVRPAEPGSGPTASGCGTG